MFNKKIIVILVVILLFILINSLKRYEKFENQNKLAVIVPLRDREEHLKQFLKNILPILEHQNINYKIFIVEQAQGKRFNKAKINNAGFLEIQKKYPQYDRFLFNDVDNYPLDKDSINYNTPLRGIHHFFGHTFCLGGFFMVGKNDFNKINGYPNDYWGWGGEDVDLQKRAEILGVKINRNKFVERNRNKKLKLINDDITSTTETKKENRPNSHKLKKNIVKYKNNPSIIGLNGLNNCDYKVLKTEDYAKNIERILIDI